MKFALPSLLAGLLATACSPSHTVGPVREGIQVPQKLVEEVSFNEVFNRVLEPKCIGCHSGDAKVKLDTYTDAARLAKKIQQVAVESRQMPKAPYGKLDTEELQILAAWVKAGAPEAPLNGSAAPGLIPLEPTFGSIKAKIITPRCVVCHSAGGEAWQVLLDTPQAMIDSPLEIVVPGSPDESGLTIVVQEGARKKMPPVKGDIQPLKQDEIDIISQWISLGAKD